MRTVPAPLQADYDSGQTTMCRLLRIQTNDSPPRVLGFTTLDQDVVYDDGAGEITYSALNGFDPTAIQTDLGYSVDNAEAFALISNDVEDGFTLEEIHAGALDDAQWKLYEINYRQPTTGRHVLLDAGDIGQVRVRHGLVWLGELLSYLVRLRQPVGGVDSITCRAIFGTPAEGQTGCGVDASALWVAGEVTSVGAEPDRVFSATLAVAPVVNPVPGRLRWTTGANVGKRVFWVETIVGAQISLGEGTPRAIQVGDTFQIRPDCGKWFERDCIGIWNNGVNFKGEPHIPVGDAGQVMTPGAQLPGGGGFQGTVPVDD